MDSVDDLIDATSKVLEIAPELYADAIKPAAQSSGKTLDLVPRAINAALSPLETWILRREFNIEKTKMLLAKELESVKAENIVSPEPYVFVPAVEAISYCMDSEPLRNMFAKVLANSMNIETKGLVHPSFVEVIRQLSPLDAEYLSFLKKVQMAVLVDYVVKFDFGAVVPAVPNVVFMSPSSRNAITTSASITNLMRLGLVYKDSTIKLDDDAYAGFMEDDIIQGIADHCVPEDIPYVEKRKRIDVSKGCLITSTYGLAFLAVCV